MIRKQKNLLAGDWICSMEKNKTAFVVGSLLAAIGVILGAFGAHGLSKTMPSYYMEIFRTGVNYHLVHAIGLLTVGIVPVAKKNKRLILFSTLAFGFGILLFSGSLYLLALTKIKFFGAITPFGGVLFILGWLSLALGALNS